MNGQAVRSDRSVSRAWRVRSWPNDPDVAHLIFTDHLTTPSASTMREGLDFAHRSGADTVRTSALFPRAATVALSVGFEPIDRLALLRRTLDTTDPVPAPSAHRVRTLRAWHHRSAAAIDREAFGPRWGNDTASLADVRTATPVHRGRYVRVDGRLAGFVIVGAAGEHGYVQRLATGRAHRRVGIAHDLVVDALGWMEHRGLGSATVNTGIDNAAALELYTRLGFVRLDEELMIAEYRFER